MNYRTLLTEKYLNRKNYEPINHKLITAFIPGTIQKVMVKEGSKVNEGKELLVLNAMKMNNLILSPMDGKIRKIHVKEGESVAKDQLLITLA